MTRPVHPIATYLASLICPVCVGLVVGIVVLAAAIWSAAHG